MCACVCKRKKYHSALSQIYRQTHVWSCVPNGFIVKMECAIQHQNSAHPNASPIIMFKLYSWDILEIIKNKDTYQRWILHIAMLAS